MSARALRLAIATVLLLGGRALAEPRVSYVSGKRAYVNVGRSDGLQVGTRLRLSRGGRARGDCTVDELADHGAACKTTRARAGDLVSFDRAGAAVAHAEPRARPTSITEAERSTVAAALESTQVELVEFQGAGRRAGLALGATLLRGAVGHEAYVSFDGRQFERERIELSLNGVSIKWAGFRAFAQITAILSSVRPEGQRFRPEAVAQVYVWETELSSRELGRPYVVSVGRIWTHHTPGLPLLDGAQVGWRHKEGKAEVGAYGGTLPDPITLVPSADRWTGGLYYAQTYTGTNRRRLRLLHTEGRLGVRGGVAAGPQLELEWALAAQVGRVFDFGVQARGTIGADDWTKPRFESARLHVGLRPTERLRIGAQVRYLGPSFTDYDRLDFAAYGPSTFGGFTQEQVVRANADLSWDPARWISLLVQGGYFRDTTADYGRGYAAVELSFPRLLRRAGGLSIGYSEELGWWSGRSANVQWSFLSSDRVRAMLRAAYLEDRPTGGYTDAASRELGLYGFVEARLVRWLSLRGTALARVPLTSSIATEIDLSRGGVVLRAELIGRL